MNSAKLIVGFVFMVTLSGFWASLLSACATDINPGGAGAPSAGTSPIASPTVILDEFAEARARFKGQCAECHGETGDGGQVTIEGKKLKVPSLKAGHALKHSDEDFVNQITDGGDGMPAFKDKVEPEEINDLVRFIRKEFQGR